MPSNSVNGTHPGAHYGVTATADDPRAGAFFRPRRLSLARSLSAAGYGFVFERLRYEVRQVDLPIAGLPARLAGLRIAQLSDIHIGAYMSGADVRRAVAMTNELGRT